MSWEKDVLKLKLEERVKTLNATRSILEERLKVAPEGYVVTNKVCERTYFYQVWWQGGKRIRKYLPKNDLRISLLFQKAYDKKELQQIIREINATESLLKELTFQKNYYDSFSDIQKSFIQPTELSDELYRAQWEAIPYQSKQDYADQLRFLTAKGEYVRSKSEALIANALFSSGIPYRYEAPLSFDSFVRLYPDFTILRMSTREEIYWEHCGQMDKSDYVRSAIRRLDAYESNHILLGHQLILSFESDKSPLNLESVQYKIDHYCK